jgi:phosphatidylglycerophosphate synthase
LIKTIPKILLFSRLVFAFAIAYLALFRLPHLSPLVLILMYLGILSDIFDGILARKYNVSNQNFRVLDTVFDLLFYCSILLYIARDNQLQIVNNILSILIILSLEILMYVISLARFGKLPSPHAILSKFWGIYLVVEFTLLIFHVTGIHFKIALIIGMLVHLDRLLIYMILNQWHHDIPSFYHAIRLRQGKDVRKLRIFND